MDAKNANISVTRARPVGVVGCALTVANTLGCGLLGKAYENALALERRQAGLVAVQQHEISVVYRGTSVGNDLADLLVEDAVLVELKTVQALDRTHEAQCVDYLRATGKHLCLLLNFGTPWLEIRRVMLGV